MNFLGQKICHRGLGHVSEQSRCKVQYVKEQQEQLLLFFDLKIGVRRRQLLFKERFALKEIEWKVQHTFAMHKAYFSTSIFEF